MDTNTYYSILAICATSIIIALIGAACCSSPDYALAPRMGVEILTEIRNMTAAINKLKE